MDRDAVPRGKIEWGGGFAEAALSCRMVAVTGVGLFPFLASVCNDWGVARPRGHGGATAFPSGLPTPLGGTGLGAMFGDQLIPGPVGR